MGPFEYFPAPTVTLAASMPTSTCTSVFNGSLVTSAATPTITATPTPIASVLSANLTGKEMIIFPNPAKTGMTFRINLEAPAHIQLEKYSAAGKHIARLEQNLAASPAAELF